MPRITYKTCAKLIPAFLLGVTAAGSVAIGEYQIASVYAVVGVASFTGFFVAAKRD
ncbi:MAG: hypothetical protein KGH59_02010 [Candidatus Micrarchaeota archaeon]|nr:hypothetical protein [Candidatus Micrarchaeota archaeon]MDE1804538.1 hypothetical protein [Candidatus Micrarchaeota archaeon]MDE1846906.1 hypothetical protein [Candidatus Micrarchaeota archaeon]